MSRSLSIYLLRCAAWLCLALPFAGLAQYSGSFSYQNLNLAIPDGNLSGLANSQTVSGLSGEIVSITVGLDIVGTGDGAFNGDYYATLVNSDGGFAVLLNRPGVTAENPFGYADNGMDITFDDSGDDVHDYQDFTYTLDSAGQLLGTWAPDGRNVSPLDVLDTTPQTAMLSDFYGTSADGTWTLFVADCSNGATGELAGWSLDIQTIAVPEPTAIPLALIGGVLAITSRFWRQNKTPRF